MVASIVRVLNDLLFELRLQGLQLFLIVGSSRSFNGCAERIIRSRRGGGAQKNQREHSKQEGATDSKHSTRQNDHSQPTYAYYGSNTVKGSRLWRWSEYRPIPAP